MFFSRQKKIDYVGLFLCLAFLNVFSALSYANPIKAMYEQATRAFERGDYKEAIEKYEKTIAMYPNIAQAHNALAMAKKESGREPQEVIDSFKKAVEIDPEYAQAYDNLCKVYYACGEFDLAIENCEAALKINPKLVTAQLSLGWIYLLGKSEPDYAIDYFEQVTDQYNIAMAHFGLGLSYFMNQEKFRVLEMITSLRRLGEDDFAGQLEVMVSRGHFIPPTVDGAPLVAPRKVPLSRQQAQEQAEQKDQSLFDPAQKEAERGSALGRMKVRLRNPALQSVQPSNTNAYQTTSSSNRLQELQERGRGLSF